ncbi:hypothetical protein F5Y15DRAFT_430318 [Xylariaceae sp. FL0016]|nr:hypothetical protein F5Y15DRAFT_430318 [Xylariaceae sp. FL0016]
MKRDAVYKQRLFYICPIVTYSEATVGCYYHHHQRHTFHTHIRITRTASLKMPKILSPKKNQTFPTQPFSSALPSQVDLNFYEAIPSSRDGSQPAATIPSQDFPVFTTDSNQSTWLPSSSSSLPAQPAQQHNFHSPPQQDFVLFDSPQPTKANANNTANSPAISAAAFGSINNGNHRRHSSNHQTTDSSTSPALQNQRVQQIIQATGHQLSPSAYTNRFNSPAQNQNQQHQFYASLSAPSSSLGVNHQNRAARPPVPLFTQGLDNQRSPAKMDLQGNFSPLTYASTGYQNSHKVDAMSSLEDFTGFGGGASTTFSSPAIPGCDLNASSASSSNLGTISPQELLVREPFASAPNSTAFTNLTTPSTFGESPDFDQYETSPSFGNGEYDNSDNWFSLFPDSNVTEGLPAVDKSPALQSEELEVVETTSQPRRKSGTSPPASGHGRHSSVSGVNSRRRDKPLPPIIVDDPRDTIAMKRARNTLAARKSRERKAQRLEDLEEKIAKLEQERDHWKRIALSRPGATG